MCGNKAKYGVTKIKNEFLDWSSLELRALGAALKYREIAFPVNFDFNTSGLTKKEIEVLEAKILFQVFLQTEFPHILILHSNLIVFRDNKTIEVDNSKDTRTNSVKIKSEEVDAKKSSEVESKQKILDRNEIEYLQNPNEDNFIRPSIGRFGDMLHPIPWQTDHLLCWQRNAADALTA